MSKSERAREMYARGERDNAVIAAETGLTAAGVWHALRTKLRETVSEPGGPTALERQIAMRLATMRGMAHERADEIAKELAKARQAGGTRA